MTDIIAEISAASQEQASGIDQVNKAVMQMDQGTQQNAALVEEATSSSQSMKQQAAALLDQVAFFKVEEDGTGQSQTGGSSFKRGNRQATKASQRGSAPANALRAANPAAPQPIGVGSSNGQERRQKDDDFFEEF